MSVFGLTLRPFDRKDLNPDDPSAVMVVPVHCDGPEDPVFYYAPRFVSRIVTNATTYKHARNIAAAGSNMDCVDSLLEFGKPVR